MREKSHESELPYGTNPEKEHMTSIREGETAMVVKKSRLVSLPAEILEKILQGFSLRECAILCTVDTRLRSIAIRCVQVITNQRHQYQLSQILPRYKKYISKFQIKELDVYFPEEVALNSESEEISRLMALIASWDYRLVQKAVPFCYVLATLVLNRFSEEQWLTDFSKFASNSLTELNLTSSLSCDKTASVLFILLNHFPNLNCLQIENNSISYLLQPEREEESLQYPHDFTRHDNLTSLNITSDIGDLGIDINVFKCIPKLCQLRMQGDIRGVKPDVLYRTLIEYCPCLQKITYIDAGFAFIQEQLLQESPSQLHPRGTVLYQEDCQPSGTKIKRQFCVYGDERTQVAKKHIRAILDLYHGPLTAAKFGVLSEKLLELSPM